MSKRLIHQLDWQASTSEILSSWSGPVIMYLDRDEWNMTSIIIGIISLESKLRQSHPMVGSRAPLAMRPPLVS